MRIEEEGGMKGRRRLRREGDEREGRGRGEREGGVGRKRKERGK